MFFAPPGYAYYAATVAALLLTILFFAINSPLRDAVNAAVYPARVPERLTRGYDRKEFTDFQATAGAKEIDGEGMSAMELYRRRILLIDIGFCVFCGLASYFLWGLVAHAAMSAPVLGLITNEKAASIYIWVIPKICVVGAVLSLSYALIDMSEDITLIKLLGLQEPTVRQVQFASFLTVTKIVTIIGSVFGAVLFGILNAVF
jgi:hypothetical protein